LKRAFLAANVAADMTSPNIIVVRPAIEEDIFRHSTLQQELARRLWTACTDRAQHGTKILTSRELCELPAEELRSSTLLVVGPFECLGTSRDRSAFVSAVASAHKRVLASVEPVGSPWYEKQLRFPLQFDAVFDIGFVPREEEHRFREVAYHFVFNGATSAEEATMRETAPVRERPIRWALVGYPTARRLELAARLTEVLDPGGFVFMPGQPNRLHPDGSPWWPQPLARHEKLSPSGLESVLSKSSYYVWCSAHDLVHYESFRFILAMRSGAVPCKVAYDSTPQNLSEIPGIYSSVATLCSAVREKGAPSIYQLAREFYLSRGPLSAHLEEALERV
jgi:hypothetical protein